MIVNEEELLKVLNKEKSYTEEDLLLFIYDLRKENARLKDKNKKVLELLQILHYNFPDYDEMHKKVEDIEEILKEN